MYSACMHCRHALGSNGAIEAMPIGRRLAFDARLGRLWIVCRQCERWNLTPFEERWDAMEQCERLFRDTRVRASTDNIGLAQWRDGTELVRVGSPLRPEFAAWRYGDQFGRRRRRGAITAVGAAAGLGAALAIGASLVITAGMVAALPLVQLLLISSALSNAGLGGHVVAMPEGGTVTMVGTPRLIGMDVDEGWGLEFGVLGYDHADLAPTYRKAWFEGTQIPLEKVVRRTLRGRDCARVLRSVLLVVNRGGATRSVIADGVQLIDDAGGPQHFPRWAAQRRHEWAAQQTSGDSGDLSHIPVAARLAFEMALHEDTERRALDGELAELERAWREAEGVAEIADGLLVPPSVAQRIEAMRTTDQHDRPA